MDLVKLRRTIPKTPTEWTEEESIVFIKLIGLEKLEDAFRENKIDGSVIMNLGKEELLKELKIENPISKQKLANWINDGLPKYKDLLSRELLIPVTLSMSSQPSNLFGVNIETQKSLEKPNPKEFDCETIFNDFLTLPFHEESSDKPSKRKQKFMIHQITERGKKRLIIIRETLEAEEIELHKVSHRFFNLPHSSRINLGSNEESHVIFSDETIHPNNTSIIYENNNYWVQDNTENTFIQILDDIIEKGSTFELGNTFLRVEQARGTLKMNILNESGEYDSFLIELKKDEKKTIGRKRNNYPPNDFDLRDAQVSNQHCIIESMEDYFLIKYNKSKNGIWKKMKKGSKEPIRTDVMYRLGNTKIRIAFTDNLNMVENNKDLNVLFDNN